MRKESTTLLISISLLTYLTFCTCALAQNTVLKGINCKLEPTERANQFQKPVKSINGEDWIVTNDFGNVVTNKEVPGLPAGYWQHTGIDYLLSGRSVDSQGQMVYAAGNGVVVFSTKSNPNPLAKRGGLVIIRHLAPAGGQYQILQYKRTVRFGKESATISYNSYQTNGIFTYYLHLDPEQVLVKQGDQVKVGQPIAQLYHMKDVPSKYVYAPHLHFEVWAKCTEIERNGYDLPGDKQFQKVVTNPLIDPSSFLSQSAMSEQDDRSRVSANIQGTIWQGTARYFNSTITYDLEFKPGGKLVEVWNDARIERIDEGAGTWRQEGDKIYTKVGESAFRWGYQGTGIIKNNLIDGYNTYIDSAGRIVDKKPFTLRKAQVSASPSQPNDDISGKAITQSWDLFWSAFRLAVQRRDRIALRAVMPNTFEWTFMHYYQGEPRSAFFRSLDSDKGRGWCTLNKIIAQGVAINNAASQMPVRISPPPPNDPYVEQCTAYFEFRNGKWWWVSFNKCPDFWTELCR